MRGVLRLLLAGFLLGRAPLAAHDLWLEPSSFRPAVGERVEVDLRVGHPGAEAETMTRNPARIERFTAVSTGGEAPILGRDGGRPAGLLRPAVPGLLTLVYRTNDARQELPAPKFEAYLAEEGLLHIAKLRRERGQADAPGRELYSRALKALLAVGGDVGSGDRPSGLEFELVSEVNPFTLQPGATFPVRVLDRGRGVPGILIDALPLDGGVGATSAVSDADGRVRLLLRRGGGWVLTAVTMREAPGGSGADWESIWTSLTFSIPQP